MTANAGRQPGANEEPTIGCLPGAEGKAVTHSIQSWDDAGVFSGARRKSGAGMVGSFVTDTPRCDGPRGPPAVSCQPIPLTIIGPRRVATASGSRFQSEMSAPNLGLRGLKSGSAWPAAKRY